MSASVRNKICFQISPHSEIHGNSIQTESIVSKGKS